MACAEYAYPCAYLDSVADDDETCVEDCYAVVIISIIMHYGIYGLDGGGGGWGWERESIDGEGTNFQLMKQLSPITVLQP